MTTHTKYQWECQPKAEAFVLDILKKTTEKNPTISRLETDLFQKTSTRLFDWLDHVIIGPSLGAEQQLEDCGFVVQTVTLDYRVYHHPGAQLPKVVVKEQGEEIQGIGVSVDSIADFLMCRGVEAKIEGSLYSPYRRCCFNPQEDTKLWIIERRGTLSLEPIVESQEALEKYLIAQELWEKRPRSLEDEEMAMHLTLLLAQELVELVGRDKAAWIVLEIERKYWQTRNAAGQIQKNRQDRLGMGWANHDHHTFRSSRRFFPQLVRLFEILGFHCRERFYAGEEAGWGAQVMENPVCRLVLFLDVDLATNEIVEDFAHQPLPELPQLGTIGLWCALHGDSILNAGMHHLEAQFMFEELTQDLAEMGIEMMNPFSSFTYLKQAFTSGEKWSVNPKRVLSLLDKKLISSEQADKFLTEGAIGSHLENLQRREGYKGFNQKNVSFIIKKTDPRLA